MTWFKVDDTFHAHPKVVGVPNAAIGLWVKAGSWCAKQRTYGRIPKSTLKLLGGTTRQAAALVEARLWEETSEGWKFVHWRKHQDGDYRRNIPPKIRAAVLARDNHQCVKCGAVDNLSMDHIIRYRDDGPDTVENLRVLCMPCNLERG